MIKLQNIGKFLTKLSKRERAVFYSAVFVVLLLLLDRSIIYPVYSKIKSLNTQIKDKEIGIVKDMRILAQKERIEAEAKKYASYASQTEAEEEAMTAFLKEIEELANKSSLYVVDMKPQGVKEEKNKSIKYMITLSCEGQMEQVMNFMYNVENSNSLLTVERYQMGPKTRESSIAQSSMSISKIAVP